MKRYCSMCAEELVEYDDHENRICWRCAPKVKYAQEQKSSIKENAISVDERKRLKDKDNDNEQKFLLMRQRIETFKAKKGISPTPLSHEYRLQLETFINNIYRFSGLNIYRDIWLSSYFSTTCSASDLSKLFGASELSRDIISKPPKLHDAPHIENAIAQFFDNIKSFIETYTDLKIITNTPDDSLETNRIANDFKKTIRILRTTLRELSIEEIFDRQFGSDLIDFFQTKIAALWRAEIEVLCDLLDERKPFLIPLLPKRTVTRDLTDKFGNVIKTPNYSEQKSLDLFEEFLDVSLTQNQKEKFILLSEQYGKINVKDAAIFCFDITKEWTFAGHDVSEIPKDGIEFEHWCAEQIQQQGWRVTVSKASGDQGVDIIAVKGQTSVCIQCKRYAQPVGNKAVQEIVAGQIHTQSNHACVIATGGFTRSAVELAKSTETLLLSAQEINLFSQTYG